MHVDNGDAASRGSYRLVGTVLDRHRRRQKLKPNGNSKINRDNNLCSAKGHCFHRE